MAEATLTPVEETQPIVPQETIPENQPPVGDADPQVIADAAPAPETTIDTASIEAEADAWLQEQESKGGEQQAPETKREQGVDPAVVQQAILMHRQNHGTRQQRADAYKQELLDQGLAEPYVNRLVKEFKDILNEEHADGYNYAGAGAVMQERVGTLQAILGAVPEPVRAKVLADMKPAEGQPNPPPAKIFEALLNAYADDKAAAAAKAAKREGFIAGRSFGERTQSSAKSGQSVNGDPVSGGPLTLEESLTLPTSILKQRTGMK